MTNLGFYSPAALERGLDGGEDRFAVFYFALYHCSPDEPAGINDLRNKLAHDFPDKVVPIGSGYVLMGQPAFLALTAYHHALSEAETLGDEFRAYSAERVRQFTEAHRRSQRLLTPIDLTEGQLAQDFQLELLTCVAIRNGQVFPRESEARLS